MSSLTEQEVGDDHHELLLSLPLDGPGLARQGQIGMIYITYITFITFGWSALHLVKIE